MRDAMNTISNPSKTKDNAEYVVTISRPGFGRFYGGSYDTRRSFYDESKARDYYTDMLVSYPDYEVTIEKR